MSLENNLKRIADALELIAKGVNEPVVTEPTVSVSTVEAPKAPVQEPVVEAPKEPDAPTPPSMEIVTPAPAPAEVPFKDINELTNYVMTKYRELGPERGQKIQSILVKLGYGNINEVKPEHFADFKQEVEAL